MGGGAVELHFGAFDASNLSRGLRRSVEPMDSIIGLMFAAGLFALAWLPNRRVLDKIRFDAADSHAMFVGPTRYEVRWATGTLTDHSLRVDEERETESRRTYNADTGQMGDSMPHDIVHRTYVETFALASPAGREELRVRHFMGRTFDRLVGRRVTAIWAVNAESLFHLYFYDWDGKSAIPFEWVTLDRPKARKWTVLAAMASGLFAADVLGYSLLLGLLVGGGVWFLAFRSPGSRYTLDKKYLAALAAKVGAPTPEEARA